MEYQRKKHPSHTKEIMNCCFSIFTISLSEFLTTRIKNNQIKDENFPMKKSNVEIHFIFSTKTHINAIYLYVFLANIKRNVMLLVCFAMMIVMLMIMKMVNDEDVSVFLIPYICIYYIYIYLGSFALFFLLLFCALSIEYILHTSSLIILYISSCLDKYLYRK